MSDVLSFLAALVGSWFDPVLLAGCVLAGWYFRPWWVAALLAVEWNVLLYAVMLKLAFKDESHARFFISGAQYLGSCGAAMIAAGIASCLATREREANSADATANSLSAEKMTVARGLTIPLTLIVLQTGWVFWMPGILNYFHDLHGPPSYWERASLHRHYWALEMPGQASVVLLGLATLWALYLGLRRSWPRSPLFLLLACIYAELLFWTVLGYLTPASIP